LGKRLRFDGEPFKIFQAANKGQLPGILHHDCGGCLLFKKDGISGSLSENARKVSCDSAVPAGKITACTVSIVPQMQAAAADLFADLL